MTYIGFDGVTTLSEEVENPRRNILLATVYVCLFTGLFSGLQVYLAQRVWPDFHTFPNLETAFVDVSRVVGGNLLFQGMALTLILASFGSGVSGQAGASRLLFGMGRTGALPEEFLWATANFASSAGFERPGNWSRDRAGFPLLQL